MQLGGADKGLTGEFPPELGNLVWDGCAVQPTCLDSNREKFLVLYEGTN